MAIFLTVEQTQTWMKICKHTLSLTLFLVAARPSPTTSPQGKAAIIFPTGLEPLQQIRQ